MNRLKSNKKSKIIWIVIFLVFFTFLYKKHSFGSYRELNELAIVSGIAIDKVEDEYLVSAEVLNSKKKESGNSDQASGNTISVFSSSAGTVQEALRKIVKECPKKLYIAHLDMLVLSNNVLKENLEDILDFFVRDNEVSKEFVILTLENEEYQAKDVISILTPIERNPTQNLLQSLSSTVKYEGVVVKSKFSNVVSRMLAKRQSNFVTSIKIEGNAKEGESEENLKESDTNTTIKIARVAYLDEENKFKGYIENEDMLNYNLINGEVTNCIIPSKIDGENIVIEVLSNNSKIDTSFQNGRFNVKNTLDLECSIVEKSPRLQDKTNDDIKEHYEKDILKNIHTSLDKMNNYYTSDIIGIENKIYKHSYKDYIKIEDEFKEKYFKNILYDINVNITFKNGDENGK